jgi:hypothetical protein
MNVASGFFLLMLGLVLAGCGTYSWERPGATDAQFRADSQSCGDAPNRPAGDFEQCMRNLGWTLKR